MASLNAHESLSFNTVINHVRAQLRDVLPNLNEQSIPDQVVRLWQTISTGEDYRAISTDATGGGGGYRTNSSNVTGDGSTVDDMIVDIIILTSLIIPMWNSPAWKRSFPCNSTVFFGSSIPIGYFRNFPDKF